MSFTVQSEDIAIRQAVDRSFATWTAIACGGRPIGLALRQTPETASCALAEYNSDAPNMNAILFVYDWADHAELPPDAFAVTLVWNVEDTGEIVDADMLLNPTLGNLTICGAECLAEDDIDIQNVVTHEAGHFLGLAHSDVEGSTMSPTAPVGQTEKRDLAQDDVDGLCAVYGALPRAACSDKDCVARHGFSPACEEPPASAASCSCAIGAVRPRALWLGALAASVSVLVARRRRGAAERLTAAARRRSRDAPVGR